MQYGSYMSESINQMEIGFLDFVVYSCGYSGLLINDGRIVGCDNEDSPGVAAPRESSV